MTNPIQVFSIVSSRADMILPQFEALCAHCTEPFQYIVVENDRKDASRGIIEHCEKNGLTCRSVVTIGITIPSDVHAAGIQWVWDLLADRQRPAVILDMDIFPLKPFRFRDYLQEDHYHLAGVAQSRGKIHYLWPGLLVINCPKIVGELRFDAGRLNSIGGNTLVDAGGGLHWYLRDKDNPVRHLRSVGEPETVRNWLPEPFRSRYEPAFDFQVIEDTWLHYRRASLWRGQPDVKLDHPKRLLLADILRGTHP